MIFAPLLAFTITLIILFLLVRTRLSRLALDQPNHRSLHSNLTPRTGGLAVMAGVLSIWFLTGNSWGGVAAILALMVISLIDDIRDLPAFVRLLVHLIISAYVALVVLPGHAWWLLVLVILSVTWMMNLYNFMDGADGLAGGMALFGFASYAIAAGVNGDMQIAMLSASVATASLAFLLFNFHPARIFLGDSGSVPLGFLAAMIGLLGWQKALWPAWFPILVFSPFVADASVTLVKRGLKGEKVWQAHRSHYYQRLIQMGWGHRKTALFEYALMALAGTTAIVLLQQPRFQMMFGLSVWAITYLAIMLVIDGKWQRKSSSH